AAASATAVARGRYRSSARGPAPSSVPGGGRPPGRGRRESGGPWVQLPSEQKLNERRSLFRLGVAVAVDLLQGVLRGGLHAVVTVLLFEVLEVRHRRRGRVAHLPERPGRRGDDERFLVLEAIHQVIHGRIRLGAHRTQRADRLDPSLEVLV